MLLKHHQNQLKAAVLVSNSQVRKITICTIMKQSGRMKGQNSKSPLKYKHVRFVQKHMVELTNILPQTVGLTEKIMKS